MDKLFGREAATIGRQIIDQAVTFTPPTPPAGDYLASPPSCATNAHESTGR